MADVPAPGPSSQSQTTKTMFQASDDTQGHVDMVTEKNSDIIHDFHKDALKLVRNGDWLKVSSQARLVTCRILEPKR